MRLALVLPYSWSRPGGVRSHVSGLAEHLRRLGHDVDLIAPVDGRDAGDGVLGVGRSLPLRDNGSVVRVALGPGVAARVSRLLSAGRYDLVHVHEPAIPVVSLSAVLAARAPVVGTFHMFAESPRWYRPFAPLCRRVVERLRVRIAVSAAAARHAGRTCPGEYLVVPNALDTTSFPRGRRSPAAPGEGSIVFVGRPEPRKGLSVLLQAFARLPAGASLDLVGVTPAELARTTPLDPFVARRVRAHGRLDDATRNELLAGAEILCVPSLRGESFGMVLLEGMAAGVPVVASAVPGYADVLPTDAGRLVPPGDAVALTGALCDLLRDPALRARLGERGRAAAGRYDWEVVAQELLGIYREAVEGPLADGGRPGLSARARPAPRPASPIRTARPPRPVRAADRRTR